MTTATQTADELQAAYTRLNEAHLALQARRKWADIPTDEQAAIVAGRAAASAAYQALLAAQLAAATAQGFTVAGTLATCPRCAERLHVSAAPAHTCNARAAAAVTTEQAKAAQTAAAKAAGYRVLAARYPGTCATCGQRFAAGTTIAYDAGEALHLGCVETTPAERTCSECGASRSTADRFCVMSRDGEGPHRWN